MNYHEKIIENSGRERGDLRGKLSNLRWTTTRQELDKDEESPANSGSESNESG